MIAKILSHVPWANRIGTDFTQISGSVLVVLVLRVFSFGMNFFANVVLARLIGAEGVGIYYQGLAVTSIAFTIGQLGLGDTLLRYISIFYVEKDWGRLINAAQKSLLSSALVSLFLTISLFLSADFIATHLFGNPELVQPLRLFSLAIVPAALSTLFASLVRALDRITISMLIDITLLPVLTLPLMIILTPSLHVQGAVLAYVIAVFVIMMGGFMVWWRLTVDYRKSKGHFESHLLLSMSMPVLWILIMNIIMSRTDIILIGIWVDSKNVGIYGVAFRIASLTTFILIAFNLVISPRFAILYSQRKMGELARLAQNASKLITIISILICLPFLLFPSFFLSLFGEEFTLGSSVLIILVIGQLVNVATGSVGRLLIMSGHEKLFRNNITIHVVINIILNILLIPKFKILGAAYANSISVISMNLTAVYLVYRYLGISIWKMSPESQI